MRRIIFMKNIATSIIGICMFVFVFGICACAMTPRVMLADYSIKNDCVIAGKNFKLSISLQNTAQKDVKNVKVTVYTENGEFIPTKGAGTAYLEKIIAGTQETIPFDLTAVNTLEEKSYRLSIKTEYAGSDGVEYVVEDAIFIPVTLNQRVSLTDLYVDVFSVSVGDTVEISGNINNIGAGVVYNVTARLEGDNLQETNSYIGNIEPGKSATLDIISRADVVTEGDHRKNTIFVTYEDRAGTTYEEEFDIMKDSFKVVKPIYSQLEKITNENKTQKMIQSILLWALLVGVVTLIIVMSIKHTRRKRRMLEEFMK